MSKPLAFLLREVTFVNFNDIFSLSNILKIFSTVAICSISDASVTTKMLSMNACACGYSEKKEFGRHRG